VPDPNQNGSTPQSEPTPSAEPGVKPGAPEANIDLQALAEQIFALLKQELRVERERLGRRL
jgi:hypothetical protein